MKTVEEMQKQIDLLKKELKDCRNELCIKCGEYRERYLGACDGCRWKDEWRKALDDAG